MTCCPEPSVKQNKLHTAASCTSCGFQWSFTFQGKGKYKTKVEKWGPVWFCADEYDRGWRLRNFTQHEIVGTRRRGSEVTYVCVCPKHDLTIPASVASPPDEVYCPGCDRSGLLAPMLIRYRDRKGRE